MMTQLHAALTDTIFSGPSMLNLIHRTKPVCFRAAIWPLYWWRFFAHFGKARPSDRFEAASPPALPLGLDLSLGSLVSENQYNPNPASVLRQEGKWERESGEQFVLLAGWQLRPLLCSTRVAGYKDKPSQFRRHEVNVSFGSSRNS